MIAVDTDVVVRLLTLDDPAQAQSAQRLFESDVVLVPQTLLLECEWVLRRLYGFPATRVVDALRGLVRLEGVVCEDAGAAEDALDWTEQGLDFADALHIASSARAHRFTTFDRGLRRRAGRASEIEVVEP